jgi:soluble lytic murein transglycosylase
MGVRSAADKDCVTILSSMRKVAFILPLVLLASPAASQAPAQPLRMAAPAVSNDISQSIADWRRLRRGDGYAFADYARFVITNPGWPNETAIRKSAEKAMRPGENPQTVIAFFRDVKPTTGSGWARLAESYAASSRQADAADAAREAWVESDLSATDEAALFGRFSRDLTAADHDRRIDSLLFARKASDAYRMMPWSSPGRRPTFTARIAMQSRDPSTETHWNAVAARSATDAGLLMERVRYLRDGNNQQAARQLLARPHNFTDRPADPERWLDTLLLVARGAMSDRQYQLAFDIARQVDDALLPGTDLASQSYSIRDDYTSLTWLAGMAAHERLNRQRDAVILFDKYARGGRSLQVATKGWYWAGRAAGYAGDQAGARAHFERAAATPELYYGQLALERLGRTVPAPAGTPALLVTDAQRTEFRLNRLVRATQALGGWGYRDEQTLFIRALSESLKTDADRILALDLASQIYRQDLAVWTARSARNAGSAFYYRAAYPTHASNNASGRLWSLTNGITRQESSYDRNAVSHAGARGMMQLMPGTAREQAGKMGLGYDFSRLTSDPSYNVMLGSAYFQRLLNQWDGNYPLAVASYNAGAGNVRKWVNAYGDPRRGTDIITWVERIPFEETRGYVQRVLENSVVYDRLNPTLGGPQPVHISAYLNKSGRPG